MSNVYQIDKVFVIRHKHSVNIDETLMLAETLSI